MMLNQQNCHFENVKHQQIHMVQSNNIFYDPYAFTCSLLLLHMSTLETVRLRGVSSSKVLLLHATLS